MPELLTAATIGWSAVRTNEKFLAPNTGLKTMSSTIPLFMFMSSNSIGANVPSLATSSARTFVFTFPGAKIRNICVVLRPESATLFIAGITTRFAGLALCETKSEPKLCSPRWR